jgi:hypothetical protein
MHFCKKNILLVFVVLLTSSKPYVKDHISLVKYNYDHCSVVFSAMLDSITNRHVAYFDIMKNYKCYNKKYAIVCMPSDRLDSIPSMWIVYANYKHNNSDTLIIDSESLTRSYINPRIPMLTTIPHYKYSQEIYKIYLNTSDFGHQNNFLYELQILDYLKNKNNK